jgi:hypothetical protein
MEIDAPPASALIKILGGAQARFEDVVILFELFELFGVGIDPVKSANQTVDEVFDLSPDSEQVG